MAASLASFAALAARLRLEQLDPIPKRICHECALILGQLEVVECFDPGGAQGQQQLSQALHDEARVRLLCRPKLGLDSEMYLERAALEPNPAAPR
jgi:hypothetical protein